MNNLALLFFEFFKIGLFTFGGGYASLPFLYSIVENYDWFTYTQLTQLIAISGITPGPIGFNMATFAGFNTAGMFGSLISSCAMVIPMIIVAGFVFRLYKKFSQDKYVKTILYVLRPTGCAMLMYVGLKLFKNLIILPKDYIGLMLLFLLFIMTFKFTRNPVIYLFSGAIFGIIIRFIS